MSKSEARLERIAPTWMNVSLQMKEDAETHKAFGWVLEMYAYAVASALHGVHHNLRKDFMIQPPWDLKTDNTFIIHYTYGCDYSLKLVHDHRVQNHMKNMVNGVLTKDPIFAHHHQEVSHYPLHESVRQKFAWDSDMPSWMYGALQDPDNVFHQLKDEDKDMLRLVQLMLKESLDKTKAIHQDSDAKNLVELRKLSVQLDSIADKQNDNYMILCIYGLIMTYTISATYKETNKWKAQSLEVVNNLASNSEEIVADFVDAVKHGVDSKYILGEGKPFVWKDSWLKKKETGVPTEYPNKK